MKPKEKKAFEPSGLVPRSIVRTFERFRQQLLPGSETAAIREYRISRYQVLVSARCLFTLLTIPIAANWLVSNWLLSPLIEHFWNTQQNEIFLNSYQEERAFDELEFFSEKLFFESLLNNTGFYESNNHNFSVNNNNTITTNLSNINVFPLSYPFELLRTSERAPFDVLPIFGKESKRSIHGKHQQDAKQSIGLLSKERAKNKSIFNDFTEISLVLSPLASKGTQGVSTNNKSKVIPLTPKGLAKQWACVAEKKPIICFAEETKRKLGNTSEGNTSYIEDGGSTSFLILPLIHKFIPDQIVLEEGSKKKRKQYYISSNILREVLNFQQNTSQGKIKKLDNFSKCIELYNERPLIEEINSLNIKEQVQDKILKLAVYYNQQTILSITNIIGDLVSLVTLGCLFIWMKPEITILKSFLIEAIYSLSDTTKSFLLILLTDLLVGFHSPRGWETALELLLKHFGLPENQDFVFLFVATFPVLLDTVFKYWIFRHLNKISPSTVATYHSMIE